MTAPSATVSCWDRARPASLHGFSRGGDKADCEVGEFLPLCDGGTVRAEALGGCLSWRSGIGRTPGGEDTCHNRKSRGHGRYQPPSRPHLPRRSAHTDRQSREPRSARTRIPAVRGSRPRGAGTAPTRAVARASAALPSSYRQSLHATMGGPLREGQSSASSETRSRDRNHLSAFGLGEVKRSRRSRCAREGTTWAF
jgi:hypothetical protein